MEPETIYIGSKCSITSIFTKNDFIITGDCDGCLTIWNKHLRRPNFTHNAHSKTILAIDHIKSLNKLVTQGRDGVIKFWKLSADNIKEIGQIETIKYTFCKMSIFHSNGQDWLCNPLNDIDEVLEIIEYPKDVITSHIDINKSNGNLMCIALFDKDAVLVGCESGYILWYKSGRMIWKYETSNCIMALAFNNCCNKLVVGSPEQELLLFHLDIDAGHNIGSVKKIKMTNNGTSCIVWREDGALFSVGCWDGCIRIFSGRKGNQLAMLRWDLSRQNTKQKNGGTCISFSEDGSLYSSADDKVLSVWNVYRNS